MAEYKKLVHQWASAEIARLQAELVRPLAVNDSVKIVGDYCHGLIGELKVIDEKNTDEGDFFGIEVDGISGYVFFRSNEIKRVENSDIDELPF